VYQKRIVSRAWDWEGRATEKGKRVVAVIDPKAEPKEEIAQRSVMAMIDDVKELMTVSERIDLQLRALAARLGVSWPT
jgi:hypothetical protein